MTPRLLTAAQAAIYCQMNPNTFRGHVDSGRLPKPSDDLNGLYDKKAIDLALDRLYGLTPEKPGYAAAVEDFFAEA